MEKKLGRPEVPAHKQLKPRFTLNLSDEENEAFTKAVEKTGMKRSHFARTAIVHFVGYILSIKPTKNDE